MQRRLLHIFRNTPFGRETLLQSVYFCKKVKLELAIYIPKFAKFLMYFENDVVQVDLNRSYLTSPDTALMNASSIVEQGGLEAEFLEPKDFPASSLPALPTNFDYMACPRSISDRSSKIGFGHIGPKVRRLVNAARFPVLMPSSAYKEWHSVAVFFGGSAKTANALRLGLNISAACNMPLDIFTQVANDFRDTYGEAIKDSGLDGEVKSSVREWHTFEMGKLSDNLYEVPHDALVVLGTYGQSPVKQIFLGSKLERICAALPNNFLVVGPKYLART
ncbi:MAG: universal stress protein [Deltaproteobacteria bacterium]|nr:universal stress protein [Deltaproteobacteria bacterium]